MFDLVFEAINIWTLICKDILTVYKKKYFISVKISDVQ